MAPRPKSHVIVRPRGYACAEAGLFVAQFDELSRNLWNDLKGTTAAELAWQPVRGRNTIGMLLAHMAIVEAFWVQRAGSGYDPVRLRRTLGLGLDDDGIPCAAGGGPPATLRAWTLADYRALHRRARAFAKRAVRRYTDADMERAFVVTLRDGRSVRRFNVRWVLHHMLEHFAGHHGQVLLIRHEYRDRNAKH